MDPEHPTAKVAPRGRRKTTGRFDTREALCAAIWSTYLHTPAKRSDIARSCRVSAATVKNILETKEGYPTLSYHVATGNRKPYRRA